MLLLALEPFQSDPHRSKRAVSFRAYVGELLIYREKVSAFSFKELNVRLRVSPNRLSPYRRPSAFIGGYQPFLEGYILNSLVREFLA